MSPAGLIEKLVRAVPAGEQEGHGKVGPSTAVRAAGMAEGPTTEGSWTPLRLSREECVLIFRAA